MGINAVTQVIVPPPKYSVDRLVDCRIGSSVRIEELFIIERGTPGLADLDRADTLERMIQNTDDAYGFPPFRHLAPALTIDGLDYHRLREKERKILAGFLSNVRARVIRSDTFGWADEIPALIRSGKAADAGDSRGLPGGGIPVGDESGDEIGRRENHRRLAEGWPRWATRASGGVA
jgi:dolichol-phosphate mannosyltransferase